MEIYKLNENIGQILDRRSDGDVDVDFGGTILTLPESENELNSTHWKFAPGGGVGYGEMSIPEWQKELTHWQNLLANIDNPEYKNYNRKNVEQVISELKDKIAKAEGSSSNEGGKTGSKEISLKTFLLGRKIKLKIPTGEVREGQFAIVELGEIKASHNEKTFQNTEGYPLDANGENINDRNYQADVNAQNKVREFAMDLQPDRLITTGVTPSGTPIINVDGIVVSGNNRTMSLKLTTRDYRDKYDDYVNYLKDECEAFGFTYHPSDIIIFSDSSGKKLPFHKPVLVRIDYDIPALNTLELSKFNKDTKKSERPIDKAIKLGKILQSNDRCKENIGQIVGAYETFSDFYASTSEQKRLMELLIQCNILTTQEQPMYFDGANFTSQGKELIESLLTGLVLDKEAVLDLDQNVRKWRSMIITSLPVLSANGTLGDDSLLDEISKAISLEAKIVKSGLSFADWIIQGNMFEDKPNPEILYLNRLLSAGRNTFKGAIEKYNSSTKNEQGNSMFGDTLTHEQIFEGQIVSRIPKDELKMIEQNQPKNTMKLTDFANQMGIEVTDMTPDNVTLEVAPEPKSKNLFIDGNWFKDHPDKILAKIELGTNWRDGSQINIYKGGIDALTKIDVSYSFLNTINNNPLISVMTTNVSDLTIKDQGAIDNITNAIDKSAKDVRKKRQRKSETKDLSKGQATASNQTLETLSISEVYNMPMDAKGTTLNQQISQDELRAFLWHMESINRTINNPEYYQLAGISLKDLLGATKEDSPNTLLRKWIEKSVVFYDGKGLVPAYLYLSGNVYEKYNRLVTIPEVEGSGQDAEHIITKYGQKVYDNQLLAMRKLFDEKKKSQLLIEETETQAGLSIVPSSKFSRSFMIKTFADENPFKWKKVTASTDKRFGKIDFLNKVKYESDKETFTELSLRDAFGYWLVSDDTISVKKGITYAEIIKYYILLMQRPRSTADPDTKEGREEIKRDEANHLRLVAKAKDQGDKLFAEFLKYQLLPEDKTRLEYEWNMKYNNNVPIDTNKIPVAFRMNKFLGNGQPSDLRAEKREAIAFTLSNGSGLLAYDVGVGKTPSAIMTISAFLDMGYCKRPLVIVPNQTYKQWLFEFKDWCAHIPINAMYNLNDSLIEEFQDSQGITKQLPSGSVTIMTYEGLEKLGYSKGMSDTLSKEIYDILVQDTGDKSEKQQDKLALKIETDSNKLIGKALAKSRINVDELGFDYVCLDEAHACKKVFTNVAGESEENTGTKQDTKSKAKVQYKIQSGSPSSRGIKGFILCYYIQKNNFGNTQLLTATPFTNSPLEVFSMLAMISYNRLKQDGLNNINTFFDLFIQISYEIVINAQLNPERKQVILGFNNLLVLQQLVREFILHKTGESVGVIRPQKWVLPVTKKKVGDLYVRLPAEEQISTSLDLSPEQKEYMQQIREYAEGDLDIDTLTPSNFYLKLFKPAKKKNSDGGVELSKNMLSEDEKIGVRLLRALNFARSVALSPYLYKFNALGTPTPESYVRTSAKLTYVVESIRTIKEHHERTNTPMSGIVIYMERGVQLFDLLREYIIKYLGFQPNEVGIISADTRVPVEKGITSEEAKEYVKNLFNGEKYNKGTGLVETLPDSQRLKILIGSSTIKEGMNLQKYSSTLFNCFLSFNPTDIQQLEGRIYRQKNAFKNVRIVNPLLIDSADIFMFEKLDQKTSRINSIFETDGHTNVLKTEEFDPGELKYALIKDPLVIARMELIEETEKLADDITDTTNAIAKMELVDDYKKNFEKQVPALRDAIEIVRPKLKNRNIEDQMKALIQIKKNRLDDDGKFMLTERDKNNRSSWGAVKVPKNMEESPITLPDLDFVASMLSNYRSFKKIEREYLIPRKVEIENIKEHTKKIQAELVQLKKSQDTIKSPENLERKIIGVKEKQEALHLRPKSMEEVVREFKSLNYLLDDVKLPSVTPKVVEQCPPVEANGVPRIDPEGLKLLDECCAKFPDTRAQNVVKIQNAEGDMIEVYTPQRQKLHDKIVKHLIGKAKCVKKEDPIAVLMGGAPGSGKSYYLKTNAPYLQSDNIWAIDADEVRAFLPEYKGWNSSATHQETKDIVNQMLDSFDVPCKHDLLYDGTMTNPNKYEPLIGRLKRLGYKVFMIFMDIPKEKSIERALKRYQENGGHEAEYGRYVPISVIEDFYQTGDKGYQRLKSQVDGYVKVESMSGKVVDRGGMQLPADREYMKGLGEPGKPEGTIKPVTKTPEVKKENVTLEKLKRYVSGAKASIPYLTGEKKATMERYIKGLESTIKYL